MCNGGGNLMNSGLKFASMGGLEPHNILSITWDETLTSNEDLYKEKHINQSMIHVTKIHNRH